MNPIRKNFESIKKKFSSIFFFSLSALFMLYYLFGFFSEEQKALLNNVSEYYFIVAIISVYLGILIPKLEYNFITFYKTLLLPLIIFVCYNTLLHCHLSIVTYLFFIPLLIFVSILYKKKTTTLYGLLFIIFIFFSKSIAVYFNISKPRIISEDLKEIDLYNNLFIIVLIIFFSVFIIYYKKQFKKIQNNYEFYLESSDETKNSINILQEHHKFEKIYKEIITVLSRDKVFQDPNFSKSKLAELIKTNETYISKALNLHGDKNFKSLINEYRIEQVLDDLNGRKYEKFTIEHIYREAGFTQQSTFNRVFKEFTSKTPSLFIEALEDKKVN